MLNDDFPLKGNDISERSTLTVDEIHSIPGGPTLSLRIVNFVHNYAARSNLKQTDVRIWNGLSSYLATTKKERKSHRGPAVPSTKQYEKHLETCEAEHLELRLQLQKLQEKVTRAESYRAMLKALVEEQRIIDQQQEAGRRGIGIATFP